MADSRTLFRFVAVRPVATPDPGTSVDRFLRPTTGPEPGTRLQRAIAVSSDRAEAKSVARSFIAGGHRIAGFDDGDPVLAVLARVWRSAVRAGRARAPEGKEVVDPEQLDAVRDRLWDSLIATFLCPEEDPRDCAELVYLLRAARLLGDPPSAADASRRREVLRAAALIPQWAVRPLSTTKEPGPESDSGPRDRGGKGTAELAEINDVRRQLRHLGLASDALRWAAAAAGRGRDDDSGAQRGDPSGRAPAGRDRGADLLVASDVGRPPWRDASAAAELVQEPAAGVLDAVGPGWRQLPTAESLRILRSREGLLHRRLVGLGGPAAATGIAVPRELTGLDLPGIGDAAVVGAGPASGTGVKGPFGHPFQGSVGDVRPLGIGDLLVVRDDLLRYELGEVAYVENVMRTESRTRVFRRLDRQVQTTVSSTEQTTESERDLQSEQRFELTGEVATTVSADQSTALGLTMSASYGPVLSLGASAEYDTHDSTTTSATDSTNYAQSVVDSSVSRLSQTVRETATVRTLSETEDTGSHAFDNSDGAEHAVGLYRYIDQVWQGQVLNYGKRLMLEFIVPRPAAFFLQARGTVNPAGVTLSPPVPLAPTFSFLDISPSTYQTWVDLYRVPDVDPPPAESVMLSKTITLPEKVHPRESGDYVLNVLSDSLSVPDGYVGREAWVLGTWTGWGDPYRLHVHVGRRIFEKESNDDYAEIYEETGTLALGVYSYQVAAAVLSIEVRCGRTEELLTVWKLATYQKIVDAVANAQAAYDAQVAAATTAAALSFSDLPTDRKRQIEAQEIKKGSLVLLTAQHFAGFGAVADAAAPFGFPEIRLGDAQEQGRYVQFYEQCFEWDQLTYTYYPYFWGDKDGWAETSTLTDTDPGFQSFLQAGAVRAVVSVRPGYERQLAYYLTMGEIWGGGATPVLDSPLYVSIVDEVMAAEDVTLDQAAPYGDSWTYSLPTTLVILQDDATLPVFAPPA